MLERKKLNLALKLIVVTSNGNCNSKVNFSSILMSLGLFEAFFIFYILAFDIRSSNKKFEVILVIDNCPESRKIDELKNCLDSFARISPFVSNIQYQDSKQYKRSTFPFENEKKLFKDRLQ